MVLHELHLPEDKLHCHRVDDVEAVPCGSMVEQGRALQVCLHAIIAVTEEMQRHPPFAVVQRTAGPAEEVLATEHRVLRPASGQSLYVAFSNIATKVSPWIDDVASSR